MPVTWIGNRRVEVPEGEAPKAEPKPKKVEEPAKAPESTEEEE